MLQPQTVHHAQREVSRRTVLVMRESVIRELTFTTVTDVHIGSVRTCTENWSINIMC